MTYSLIRYLGGRSARIFETGVVCLFLDLCSFKHALHMKPSTSILDQFLNSLNRNPILVF